MNKYFIKPKVIYFSFILNVFSLNSSQEVKKRVHWSPKNDVMLIETREERKKSALKHLGKNFAERFTLIDEMRAIFAESNDYQNRLAQLVLRMPKHKQDYEQDYAVLCYFGNCLREKNNSFNEKCKTYIQKFIAANGEVDDVEKLYTMHRKLAKYRVQVRGIRRQTNPLLQKYENYTKKRNKEKKKRKHILCI